MPYPVASDLERPPVFQRAHVFLRLALLVVIGWIGHPFGLLWLGVPVIAAILVAQKGGQAASYEDARSMVARIPGSHWVTVERGGHIFIHNDAHALAEIAGFLTLSTDQRPM